MLFKLSLFLQLFLLSLQTWLTDKSRYKLKKVNQSQQQSRARVEPCVVFFSAGMQTDEEHLERELKVEEERNEQEEQAKVAESLDLNEDCTDYEDSGLDSVSEDDL